MIIVLLRTKQSDYYYLPLLVMGEVSLLLAAGAEPSALKLQKILLMLWMATYL
jgi:hypothetical protein